MKCSLRAAKPVDQIVVHDAIVHATYSISKLSQAAHKYIWLSPVITNTIVRYTGSIACHNLALLLRLCQLHFPGDTYARQPITLRDGAILDGRNRYQACCELEITPKFVECTGDRWAYVWSLHGQRRNLSDDQRAQIFIFVERESERWQVERNAIAEKANKKRSAAAKGNTNAVKGRGKNSSRTTCPTTVSECERDKTKHLKANAARVNAGAIARAEALERAAPELAAKVRSGTMKPAEARRLASRTKRRKTSR